MGRLIYEEDVIKKIEKAMCEDGFRSSTGLIHKETAYEAIKSVPTAQPETKPISYRDCTDAMMKMWMMNVLTDGQYNRIMDKLNANYSLSPSSW